MINLVFLDIYSTSRHLDKALPCADSAHVNKVVDILSVCNFFCHMACSLDVIKESIPMYGIDSLHLSCHSTPIGRVWRGSGGWKQNLNLDYVYTPKQFFWHNTGAEASVHLMYLLLCMAEAASTFSTIAIFG